MDNNMMERIKYLKRELFMDGFDTIENFVGYKLNEDEDDDEKKAKRVFYNCDWQHPSTEFTEMEAFDEEDDCDAQYYYAETRWCIDDVIDAAKRKGIVLNPQQAEQWWQKNEKWFKDTLTEYGNEILFNVDFSEV